MEMSKVFLKDNCNHRSSTQIFIIIIVTMGLTMLALIMCKVG